MNAQTAAAPTRLKLKFKWRSHGMADELEIFLTDLAPEAKARVLTFLKIKAAEEVNLDVFPLCVLSKPQ
jgi:hypothetical protein